MGLEGFGEVSHIVYTRNVGAAPLVPWPEHGGTIESVAPAARIFGVAKVSGLIGDHTTVTGFGVVDTEGAALHYVAPVGEKDDCVDRALRNITPYLGETTA